jgi:prevent-host-death family protein
MERAVGIRGLRDALTTHLGRVRRGERLVITDRGHPVAMLLPYRRAGTRSRSERLTAALASGHVAPAERPLVKRPLPATGRGRRLSRLIVEDRRSSTPTRA